RVAGATSMNEDLADAPRVPSSTPAMAVSVSSDTTAVLADSAALGVPTNRTDLEGQGPNAGEAPGAAEPHAAPAHESTPAFALPALPDSPAPVQPAAAPTSFPAPRASTPSPAQWATTAPAEERATTPPPAIAPASP